MTTTVTSEAAPHVRSIAVYIPKNAPLGYAAAESYLYLPKSFNAATLRFPEGHRRVLITTTVEEFP